MFTSSAADHRIKELGVSRDIRKEEAGFFTQRIVTKNNSNLLEESKWIEGIFYSLVF